MTGGDHHTKNERVWDPLVRLFHWSLVAAFATAWWERGEAAIHETAGKFVLGLIIFRVGWGFIGPGSARFASFVKGPRTTLGYVLSIVTRRPEHHIGHNPAGAAMIGLMLLCLATTAASGILMSTTALWGNSQIEWVHGTAANTMLVLIAGHLAGILVAGVQHRENLVWAMITGWKRVPNATVPYLGDLKFTWRTVLAALFVFGFGVGSWSASTTLLNASAWRLHKTLQAELRKVGCSKSIVTGPRIEIYPIVQLVYGVQTASASEVQNYVVSASAALDRRPTLSFDVLTRACKRAPLANDVLGTPVLRSLSAVPPGSSSDGKYPSSKHLKALRADSKDVASSFVRRKVSTPQWPMPFTHEHVLAMVQQPQVKTEAVRATPFHALTRIVPRKTLRTKKLRRHKVLRKGSSRKWTRARAKPNVVETDGDRHDENDGHNRGRGKGSD